MKTNPDNKKTNRSKKIIRKNIQKARDSLSGKTRSSGSLSIAEKFMGLDHYKHSKEILAYFPFRSEIDTTIIIRRALKQGKKIILPRVSGKKLDLYYINNLTTDLCPGSFDIMEPIPAKCKASPYRTIDLILVPGVGFDRNFNRLGYGGGFYDKLLEKLPVKTPRIALAFNLQIIESIPAMAHDLKVDIIITEKEIFASDNNKDTARK
jgi:5-formyltetrahydrofolate cyclo-ligase